MLHLDRVGLTVGETTVLRDVTLDVDVRTLAVIGDNGSGKSSFARVVGGLVRPTTGTVRVLGVEPRGRSGALRKRTALVFSNPDTQIIMPTVVEDVAFSLRGEGLSKQEQAARAGEALARFGLAELADASAHELSSGQKQLLALCGAFVRDPDLVIADEPTAYLDARNARAVADHLFAPDGHRLVLVTHDLALAAGCDAAVLFADGGVVEVGPADAVIARYERELAC
ncbi:energy-coupling factor ABC transporter ATP-binding protein [Microbacterium sp. bgisy189]|uniref:energy-coupling factor ABC transporter ATP-binding protein n=1 Tax=Microbacterium sp. bgisy189 TaxID=3413798 RepID=UPI003EB83048